MQPKFSNLSATDTARLDRQRALVAHELTTRYRATLSRSNADLVLIQRLLDDRAFTLTQTYELQSLGVVFGDVLTVETALRWMMVSDEYGTDPTLVLPGTTLQVNSLTMISKRVERGERVDVSDLFARATDSVRNPPADLR